MTSGIYEIVNTVNGKRYIGSAVNLKVRWRVHRRSLVKGAHVNRHLQASWNKNGGAEFAFKILERCDRTRLIEREQYYMDALRPEFNICPTAGSMLGVKLTAEHRAKISAAMIGGAQWMVGKKLSAETRAKMRAARLGKRNSPEAYAKVSASMMGNQRMLGKKHSVETIAKMRASHAGKMLGKKLSPETRAKMSASQLRRHEAQRQEMRP